MDLHLDSREAALLARVLSHRLEELRREIHHTDSRSFKAELKAEEALLDSLLGRLQAPALMGM